MNLDFYSEDIPQCPYSYRACLWGHKDMVFCYQIGGELWDIQYSPCCAGCISGEESVAWYIYLQDESLGMDAR